MKISLSTLLLATLLCSGCASTQRKETLMSAAGFRTIIPTTPAQIAKLKSMPQDKVIPVSKKGTTFFLFADAASNTMLIGNQKQYQQYQQYALQYKLQEKAENTAALNADADEWGCWGGGCWGPGFY
jgi:hypothetical protein